MGRPYDIDLRKEAIELYENGEKRAVITQKLVIGIATLNRWIKRNREGTLKPKVKSYMGGGRKVQHKDVVAYVQEKPNAFLREIGEIFGIRAQTVLYILKKNNISLKKRRRAKSEEENLEDQQIQRHEENPAQTQNEEA